MPIGCYHYAESDLHTAAVEAAHFWAVAGTFIKGDGKSMMPMLDMEGGALSGHVGATNVSEWVDQWCIAISNYAAAVGLNIKPMIYVSECNASAFDTRVAKWTPWIAHYSGDDPQTSTPWTARARATTDGAAGRCGSIAPPLPFRALPATSITTSSTAGLTKCLQRS